MRCSSRLATALAALLVSSCAMKSNDSSPVSTEAEPAKRAEDRPAQAPAPVEPAAEQAQKTPQRAQDDTDRGGKDGAKGGAARAETAARSWFPETFLFEPLLVTDAQGKGELDVRVPDRLTTWRVLALAHARTGAQAGAVARFAGTLPTYVDPAVPPFLVQGDRVRVPIQLVNTTHAPVTGAFTVSAGPLGASPSGAASRSGGPANGGASANTAAPPSGGAVLVTGTRTVPADGSLLEYATLSAERAQPIQLHAALAGSDAVERTIAVVPFGRPVTQTHSGTLAAPRTITTAAMPGADPATDRARLTVFPGALAVLRSELSLSPARTGAADDAYALLLAGTATRLMAALGDRADPEAVRQLALVAGQRVLRASASTVDGGGSVPAGSAAGGQRDQIERAVLVTEPAAAHPEHAVLARLAERQAAFLAQHQRPDGTFGGETGWSLQRLLVLTADATRAVAALQTTPVARQRATAVVLHATAAFARTADDVTDGYTAAAILASGPLPAALTQQLRARVHKAIASGADGAKHLVVPAGVVRGDGSAPTELEATALAVLALQGEPNAPLADLGATLLAGYALPGGWGDGRTNLVAMRAVLALFSSPLPASIRVSLRCDGAEVAHGTLEGNKLHDLLALAAPAQLAAAHTWQVVAEPAVPGLGFALALDSWLPWTAAAMTDLALEIAPRVTTTVGAPVELAITAAAASALPIHVRHALPAGVQADQASLQALVDDRVITRFELADGAVDLWLPAAPHAVTAHYRAVATLAGTLHSGPSLIEAGDARVQVPPAAWTIQ